MKIKKNFFNWIKDFFLIHKFSKYLNIKNIYFINYNSIFIIGRNKNLLNFILNTNIPIIQCERGGGETFHNKGQDIIYILFFIKNIISKYLFLNFIENLIINISLNNKIKNLLIKNGIFINNKKIIFFGFKIINKFSIYGISINIKINLLKFKKINPCNTNNIKIIKLNNIKNNKLFLKNKKIIKFIYLYKN